MMLKSIIPMINNQMDKQTDAEITWWFTWVKVSSNQGFLLESTSQKGHGLLRFVLGPSNLWKLPYRKKLERVAVECLTCPL